MYRKIAGRETADTDPGKRFVLHRERFVGAEEWDMGKSWRVRGCRERKPILCTPVGGQPESKS
jgi:hypothetical protein